MNRFLKRIRRHRNSIVMFAIEAVVYLGLFAIFWGLMSVRNWQLMHISRTSATTVITYLLAATVMRSVYGGFDVGRKKNRPVISSMTLAAVVTDVIAYLQLQIMNVNSNNHDHLILFGEDFVFLLVAIIAQFLFLILTVRYGNRIFFKLNPPRKCLLILGNEEDRVRTLKKLDRYKLQWNIEKVAVWGEQDLQPLIRDAEVCFLCGLHAENQMSIMQQCYDLQKDVFCQAQLQDIMLSNSRQVVVDDTPFLSMEYRRMTLLQRIIKRLGDIAASGAVLLVFSPLLLLIALCIKLEDHGPVLFKQKRLTVNGRVFTICKFRTMSEESSERKEQVSARQDDDRITRIGRILRRTRLDELPQLWNILKGDMTLVGPRPEMLQNIEKYKKQLPAFVYREKMKAGLTGYAQIEGRYNTTPEDKLMLDLMYIESFSIWLDIKLIFRTLTVFFKSDSTEGFSADDPEQKKNA